MDPRQWILQPLVDAGLPSSTIADLLFRLSFEAVSRDGDLGDGAHAIAHDQPVLVQAAWVETLSRMIAAAELTA